MPNSSRKFDDRQLTIYEFLSKAKCHNVAASTAGMYKIYDQLQVCLRAAIKSCQLSRHIPAEYLPAFCKAVGDNRPVAILGEMVGMFCLPGPDAPRSEIRKLDEEAAVIREEKKRREVLLKEMER